MNLHQQKECWAYALATEPSLLHFVESLIGPDIVLASTQLAAKPPSPVGDGGAWYPSNSNLDLHPNSVIISTHLTLTLTLTLTITITISLTLISTHRTLILALTLTGTHV